MQNNSSPFGTNKPYNQSGSGVKMNSQHIHNGNKSNPLSSNQQGKKEKKKKTRVLDLVMALLVTASGALFFLCVTRSIDGVAILNPWISAMICAMIFEILIILFAITVAVKKMIIPITIIAFLPSIIFVPTLWHILVVMVAVFIAISGLYTMRRTLFNGLKISIPTIVRSGISYLSFAIIIVITSQYYFFVSAHKDVIFDASQYVKSSNFIVDYLLQTSGVKEVSINTMTVDDFLKFIVEKTSQQQGPEISNEDVGMLVRLAEDTGVNVDVKKLENSAEEEVLVRMHDNLTTMLGHEITGNELASDILSELVTKQINTAIQRNEFLNKYKSFIFTGFFFLIVFSLASIVRIFVGWGTRFVFMLMREFKIIKVEKIQRDAEVIIL